MRMILKVVALPLLLLVKVFCVIGNTAVNLSSYVVGLLLLVLGGCAVYCIVQANWRSLAILAVMALVVFVVLFLCIWLIVKAEGITELLRNFIYS